ncbi:MAG: MiaB/RimO family radical SAM methylthiotransferase [Phycisphaeraceae bacterium]
MAPSNTHPSPDDVPPTPHAAAERSEAAGTPRKPDPANPTPNPAVYLETFGCQMNVLDSQLVSAQLRSLGYRFTDAPDDADVVLYNTCSVREHAEAKVYSRVGRVGKAKADKPHVVLGVIGCMAERDGEDMLRRYPQIDLLCGPGELDKLPGMIDNAVRTDPHRRAAIAGKSQRVALQGDTHRRTGTLAAAEDQLELIDLARSFSPHQVGSAPRSAYVRITRGCNKFCTYCVVPKTRGAEVHRPPQHIIDECKRLADAGVIEITLLGQTVNHYHFDHTRATEKDGLLQPQIGAAVKNHGTTFEAHGVTPWACGGQLTRFSDLLHRIHEEVPHLQRLRFVTSFPRDFGDDILHVIRDCPRICRYLHLPVQSGSNRMLQLMNRGYTVEEFKELIHRVRETLPDCEVATDIITGFPTETEDDHHATAELMRWARFKNSFIFKYSPRPGTAAMKKFEDDVPTEAKKRRNRELLAIQHEASAAVHAKYVGQTLPVFVEGVSRKHVKAQAAATSTSAADPRVTLGWETRPQAATATALALADPAEEHEAAAEPTAQLAARTEHDLITLFDGPECLIGTIARCRITTAQPLALFGELA